MITPFDGALLKGMEDAVAVPVNDHAFVVNTDMLVASTDVLPEMTVGEIASISVLTTKAWSFTGTATASSIPLSKAPSKGVINS